MACWTNKKQTSRMSFLKLCQNIIQRLTRTNRVFVKNPKGKWSNESLEVAMDAIEKNITSL